MYKVSVTSCNNYEYQNVEQAVFRCLDKIPEIKQKLKPNSKVLVKANLLSDKAPEKAVTTHPSIIQAIVIYFQLIGCNVTIGDSPGAPHGFTKEILKTVYDATGMTKVAKNTGCNLNFDTSIINVVNEGAVCLKEMTVAKFVYDADFIISAAKLKTHAMMMYTGAVKNLFGIIPGIVKMKYHYKLSNSSTFAEHLVDICEYVKPSLSVIDAIDGMDGNGPSAGNIRHMGLIMASENPYAIDLAATNIVGINASDVPTISASIKRSLCTGNLTDIEMVDMNFKDIHVESFQLPDTITATNTIPAINYSICKSCGICKKACPAQVITMVEKKPVINLDLCIKCFCCHELCPEKAVYIEKFQSWDMSNSYKYTGCH